MAGKGSENAPVRRHPGVMPALRTKKDGGAREEEGAAVRSRKPREEEGFSEPCNQCRTMVTRNPQIASPHRTRKPDLEGQKLKPWCSEAGFRVAFNLPTEEKIAPCCNCTRGSRCMAAMLQLHGSARLRGPGGKVRMGRPCGPPTGPGYMANRIRTGGRPAYGQGPCRRPADSAAEETAWR